MLSRFATTGPPSSGMEPSGPNGASPAGICALAVGYDSPDDGKDNTHGTRCGFIVSAGCDRKIRFWDLARPEFSSIVSGLDPVSENNGLTGKPRYELSQPSPNMLITAEYLPNSNSSAGAGSSTGTGVGGGSKSGRKGASGRPPRSTVISLQQQQLLKSHLDFIQDVAVLRVPYGMVISADRAGMVYIFQ